MSQIQSAVISIYDPKATLHGSGASGVGSYTKNLLTNMDSTHKSHIVVCCDYSPDSPQEVYEENGLLIDRCWQKKGWFHWLREILSTLNKYPHLKTIHIQHEFNMFGSILTVPVFLVLLFLLRKYRLIVTYHGVVDTKSMDAQYREINSLPAFLPLWLLQFCFWFFYKVSSWFIDTAIVHEQHFQTILQRYGFRTQQVEVIPHGVEDLTLELTKDQAKQQLDIPSDKIVLLYFGFWAGYKGIELLLDGFERLDPKRYHLILAGGVPKRTMNDLHFQEWYQKVNARAKSMDGVLRLEGFVPNDLIPVMYAAADALMMPYLYLLAASGPMALSIAYRLPFLVSEVFAPVIHHEQLLFQKTPQSLAECVLNLTNNNSHVQSYIDQLRAQRLRPVISRKTALLYM